MAEVRITRAGRVETRIATQDIGSGSRTVAALVTSMAFGWLPLERIDVRIGDSDLPPSGASGGSSTTGMVHKEVREAAGRAQRKLFDACAGVLKVPADRLELRDGGRVGVTGGGTSLSWEEAVATLSEDAIGHFDLPIEAGSIWVVVEEDGIIRPGGKDKYTA